MQNTNMCFCICPTPVQPSPSTRSTKILAQCLCYLLPNSTLPPQRAQRSSPTAGSGPRWGWGARLLRQIDLIAHMFRSRLGGRRGSQMRRSGAGAATDVVLLFGCTAKFPKKTTLETVYYNEMNIRFVGRELWRDVRLSRNCCNKTELGNNFGFNVCKKWKKQSLQPFVAS